MLFPVFHLNGETACAVSLPSQLERSLVINFLLSCALGLVGAHQSFWLRKLQTRLPGDVVHAFTRCHHYLSAMYPHSAMLRALSLRGRLFYLNELWGYRLVAQQYFEFDCRNQRLWRALHMPNRNSWTTGGKATAIKLRNEALSKYYENPKHCKECGEVIVVGDQKVSDIRQKTFCTRSCAAIFNNRQRGISCPPKKHVCLQCGASKSSRGLRCRKCTKRGGRSSLSLTKKEMFAKRNSWQSARSEFRTLAIEAVAAREKKCFVCGYNKHVEVCHIKSVSSFSGDTLLSVISDPDNLVLLCPNCHWEFDKGITLL